MSEQPQQPAGWYPDPFAAVPGAMRFWDGVRWTTQVQSPLPEAAPQSPGGQAYGTSPYGASATGDRPQSGTQQGWQQPGPLGAHPEEPWRVTGSQPGQRAGELASWGRRVGAYLLDAIPLIIVGTIVLMATGVTDAMNAAIASGDAAALDEVSAMLSPLSPIGLTVTFANLAIAAVYNIGFHVARGQTPGKMLVGIRVRMADVDRNPDLRAAGLRWLVQFGPGALNGVAMLGFLAGLFNLVDHLFPLWDARKQTLHDKAGRTVVVRTR